MAFYDPTGDVVACGEFNNRDSKECFSFDGITWEPLPSLQENHRPVAYNTRSYFMEGIGLWVGGGDGDGSGEMKNEVLNSEGQWITLPVDSPYERPNENITFPDPCFVPLNSTHLFFSGGWINGEYLVETWILDLVTLVWTSSLPMLTPRDGHACVMTDEGEVLIAGGWNENNLSTVHIFNLVTQEWRESVNLPSELDAGASGLLLWNEKIILVEYETDKIWEREENLEWRLMNSSMGASFNGIRDNAVMVPDSWREGCS